MNNSYKDINAAAYLDQSIRLVTIDENGLEVDCYDRVVSDLRDKEEKILEILKKERRKNRLIHFAYNVQPKMFVANILLTICALIMYIICVVYGRTDISRSTDTFLVFLVQYNIENICRYALPIMLILSLLSLVFYMMGRDNNKVRWLMEMMKVKSLNELKSNSDNRINYLKSDIYSLQLRKHKIKYAKHSR